MPLSDLMKNSLLFSLLGTEGHKQFSDNPTIETLNMATYADLSKVVMEHFQHLVNTVHAIWDLQHCQQGASEAAAEFLATLVTSFLTVATAPLRPRRSSLCQCCSGAIQKWHSLKC